MKVILDVGTKNYACYLSGHALCDFLAKHESNKWLTRGYITTLDYLPLLQLQ